MADHGPPSKRIRLSPGDGARTISEVQISSEQLLPQEGNQAFVLHATPSLCSVSAEVNTDLQGMNTDVNLEGIWDMNLGIGTSPFHFEHPYEIMSFDEVA